MKRNLLILTASLLLSGFAFNQNYNTALGFKGGFPGFGALNVKHMLGGKSAIEASLGGGRNHLWLQGLYEINNDLGSGFDWYYGIGADLGFWTGHDYYYHYNDRYYNGAYGGIDGVIGIEYTFSEIPLNLALDAVPTIRVFPYVGFNFYGNFAIRFAIK